ncbi:MAG: hypothetical protein QGH94_01735 [Phycisphaerae bacterium]|jgi:hypothetical protein|nr:hypothetical protein [Phycisphaerae bacterium]
MSIKQLRAFLFSAACLIVIATAAWAADPPADKSARDKRRPKTYLAIFINGYAGDPMPAQPDQFEKLLKTITTEGRFNAVLCKYTPQREALCRKYKVLMVADLLADGLHVYRNPKECETLLKKLQGNDSIAAYHLWSDRFGKTGAGRARDINNVHKWDPTHATYIGTYKNYGLEHLAKSDFISYYDFSWKRGRDKNFRNLLSAWKTALANDSRLGRYCETDAGLAGKGNPNRLMYIQTTSIACGLRAAMWHIGSRIMNMKTFEFNQYGKDLAKVNAWIEPMRTEIAKIGLPKAIYSTPWTTDWNHKPVPQTDGKIVMPPGLEKNGFPKDFWIQPVGGEFVMGVSKYDSGDKDVLFIANHDAYGEQNVKLKLTKPSKPHLFNRKTGKYDLLPITDGAVGFKLEPAGGAIILFK